METSKILTHLVGRKFLSKDLGSDGVGDTLQNWQEMFFKYEASSSAVSQKIQKRDIQLFRQFLIEHEGNDNRLAWSPRISAAYIDYLKSVHINGVRKWGDRVINRMIASLKTFAKWIDFMSNRSDLPFQTFPLGNPMKCIKSLPIAGKLDVFKALEEKEKRKLLDAADKLLIDGGVSIDRNRYKDVAKRPRRRYARPYRDRAIMYLLTGCALRRTAVTNLLLKDINFKDRSLKVVEKGSLTNHYHFTKEASAAIKDYIKNERSLDADHWQLPNLFLSCHNMHNTQGKLQAKNINYIWNKLCKQAGIEGKTPHSARHYIGRKLGLKLGASAVQKELNHKSAATSLQYINIKKEEIKEALEN